MATRKLWAIDGNQQRLDGGAMFGNAPRALWQRWAQPDDANRIPLACRAMLIDDGRTILFEAGIGVFFEPKLRARFGVVEDKHMLLENLAAIGLAPADIDIVVLSHLHFDHAGGLLTAYDEHRAPELVFPRAKYVVGEEAWQRAKHPHVRDRASFIPELLPLLEGASLERVSSDHSEVLGDAYRFHRSEGHTPGLLLAEVPSDDGPVVFGGDLVPGIPWVHAPITMGYDRFPERLIEEKTALLTDLSQRGGRLFFTHDPGTSIATIRYEKGRFSAHDPLANPHAMTL